MDFSFSDLIALGSAFFAGFSALYARRAISESKYQNEISLHSNRLEIYKGVNNFGSKLTAYGPAIQESVAWDFHQWVQLSEFYFDSSIHQRLDQAFVDALKLLAKNDEWQLARDEGNLSAKDINEQRYKIHKLLRDECLSISNEMKKCLRLAKS